MGITTFDTLKFVRRLEEAGMPSHQAEVQAEVLTEAFNVNLETLVTKDYLTVQFAERKANVDTQFAEQKAYIDTRFAEQKSYMDTRFAEQKSYMDTRFAEQTSYMDTRFAEQKSYMDTRFEQQYANIRVQNRILGLVLVVTVVPFLQSLASFMP